MSTFFTEEKTEVLSDGKILSILKVEGYIQFEAIDEMANKIAQAYEKKIYYLLLDLSDVQLITSSGLATLVKFYEQFQQAGRWLAFLSVPTKIETLFETLGIANYFLQFPDQETALEFFLQGGKEAMMQKVIEPMPFLDAEPASTQAETMRFPDPENKAKERMQSLASFKRKETLFDINIPQEVENEALISRETKKGAYGSPVFESAIEKSAKAPLSSSSNRLGPSEIFAATRTPFPTRAPNDKKVNPSDTKRMLPCKVSLRLYGKMALAETYPLRVTLSVGPEKASYENALEEGPEVTISPLFPACLVIPASRKIILGSKFNAALFDITPLVSGTHTAKIELTCMNTPREPIRLPVLVFQRWWRTIIPALVVLMLVLSTLLSMYQPLPPSVSQPLSLFVDFCGGLFYPTLVLAALAMALCLYLEKTTKARQDIHNVDFVLK